MFENLCAPALVYVLFSLTQIVIDVSKGLYNTAFVKMWVAFIVTFLLNYLCDSGLGVISWFMVFVPFVLMTLIISILLFVFGLDPATGKMSNPPYPVEKKPQQQYSDLDMRAQVIAQQNTIDTKPTSETEQTSEDKKVEDTTVAQQPPQKSEFEKALETIHNTIQSHKTDLVPSYTTTVITSTIKDGSKQSSTSMY